MEMSIARPYFALIGRFGLAPQNENMNPKERNEYMPKVKKMGNTSTGQ